MRPKGCALLLLAAVTLSPWTWVAADGVAEPPAPWAQRLAPIPESDLGGAEPLMREAVGTARVHIDRLLADPQSDPKDLARAYGRLGALLILLEVEAPADSALGNACILDPKEVRWPYYRGYLALLSGNLERALEDLESARALAPDYAPIDLRLGKARLELGDLTEARASLGLALETPGVAAAAHFYLGQIANLERRYQDAVGHFEATLEADPQATEAHWPLAQALRALGRDEQALGHMAQVAPRSPPLADPLVDELKAAARQSIPAFERAIHAVGQHDFETAAREFAAGLAADPDNRAARISQARVLYLTGDREGAERELDLSLAADPAPPLALFFKAVLRQSAGDPEGAATLYGLVLAQVPNHSGAHFYRACLDLVAGRYGDAAAGFRAALAGEDPPPPARLLALVADHRAGEAQTRTAARLADLLGESPADLGLRHAQIRLLAASPDPMVRDPGRARELAEVIAFEQPGPLSLRSLALAQAGAGDFQSASTTVSQALGLAGGWLPPEFQSVMERELRLYREGTLDPEPWPLDDPLLTPPPLDVAGILRDYPAAVPY